MPIEIADSDDAGAAGSGAAAIGGAAAAAGGKKRKQTTGGRTSDFTTVKGWRHSEWIWGHHKDASKLQREVAFKRCRDMKIIYCRGCSKELAANSAGWYEHFETSACKTKRIDPKNHFSGLMLTVMRPVTSVSYGASTCEGTCTVPRPNATTARVKRHRTVHSRTPPHRRQ